MEIFCGSRLAVDYDLYKVKVDELAKHTKANVRDASIGIVERHNIYSAYTVLCLMSCSGHRPVTDPFCFLSDFDLDDNFVIINDKVISPSYENRISWLSDIAKSQIEEYIKHLETLSTFIEDKTTSEIINRLLDKNVSRAKQGIPLLFFLEENISGIVNIKRASLGTVLKDLWPYKWNNIRHILESKLYEEGIAIDAINAHLGHHNNNQHPFGSKTSWTARECGDNVKQVLNKLSVEQGWKIIAGLTKATNDSRKIKLYQSKPFGNIKRKEDLKIQKEILNNKIRDILQKYFTDTSELKDLLTNKETQLSVQKEIISQCSESKRLLNHTLKTFDNFIREASFNHNMPLIRANKPFDDELSPFYGNWIDLYKNSKDVRDNYISYLKNRDHNSSDPEMLWAEICTSAILFDGIAQEDLIADIIKTGPAGLLKLKKWNVFYDLYKDRTSNKDGDDSISPDWRWQPGSLSKGLIYGMLNRLGDTASITLTTSKTKKHIELIGQAILPKQHANNKHPSINQILILSQAFWRYHMPNVFHQILVGKKHTSPLPQSVYARVIRKRRVQTLSKVDIEKPSLDSYTPHTINSDQDYDNNRFKRSISDIFDKANSINGNKKQKTYIINQIEQFLDSSSNHSRTAFYLAKWVIHLCNRKIKNRKYLELSTIRTHYYRISNALLNLTRADNIIDYDTEDIEDLYSKIISFKYNSEKDLKDHANNCKLRAIQLSQFDTFLQNQFCLESEDVDWQYIAGEWAQYLDKKVDANLITPTEYIHTIDLIRKHKDFTDYQRIWIAVFIIIGFRFGLRISEVRRLTIQDIQMTKNQIILQVISSKHGKTKSLSGIRQVPLIGELSENELHFIQSIVHRAKSNPLEGIRTPLFTDPSNTDQLIDRALVWQTIHPILRHITGSPTVRFHSLRHGFANGLFSMLFMKYGYRLIDLELESLWKDNTTNLKLLNNSGTQVESHRLTALTTIIGHADSSTTLNSYIHILDDVISGYTEIAFAATISINELSSILNISESLMERRRRNCKAARDDGHATLKSIQLDEKIPSYFIKRTNWPLTLPETDSFTPLTLQIIDLIFEWYGQRGRNLHRLNVIFDVPQNDIIRLIDIGAKAEKESSFFHYGLGGHLLNSWIEPVTHPETNKKNFERESYSYLLDKAENILTTPYDTKILLNASSIWTASNTTSEDRHSYILDGPDSLETFIAGIYLLGFNNNDLIISIPDDLTNIQKQKVHNKLKMFNIHISTQNGKIRKQNRQKGDLRKDRIRLSLKRGQSGVIQYNQTLSRIFFVVSVFSKFSTNINNQH